MKITAKWALIGIAFTVIADMAGAQAVGLTRAVVTRADVSVPNREAVVVKAELAPGGTSGWHNHPGDEASYVTDGELTLLIAGQAPRKLMAGDAFVVPGGKTHNAINSSASPAKLIGVYMVEKGQPLASPAVMPAE
jgi:quercetin dioxygenase-like cupin family protein